MMSLIFLILFIICKPSNLPLRYSFLFILQCLLTSRLTLFRLSTLLWFVSCNHRLLPLIYTNHKRPSSNHGLYCFNSNRSLALFSWLLIFSLMFSQVLFMALLSFMFSKAVNLFHILISSCFLRSSSLSFLRLNLSTSNCYAACLLTANLSLSHATIR